MPAAVRPPAPEYAAACKDGRELSGFPLPEKAPWCGSRVTQLQADTVQSITGHRDTTSLPRRPRGRRLCQICACASMLGKGPFQGTKLYCLNCASLAALIKGRGAVKALRKAVADLGVPESLAERNALVAWARLHQQPDLADQKFGFSSDKDPGLGPGVEGGIQGGHGQVEVIMKAAVASTSTALHMRVSDPLMVRIHSYSIQATAEPFLTYAQYHSFNVSGENMYVHMYTCPFSPV